ncbi:MAG: hypothetical protein PVH38_10490, partial [Gammaproteobacteria bacterium]
MLATLEKPLSAPNLRAFYTAMEAVLRGRGRPMIAPAGSGHGSRFCGGPRQPLRSGFVSLRNGTEG